MTLHPPSRRGALRAALSITLALAAAAGAGLYAPATRAATTPASFDTAFQQFQRALGGDDSAVDAAAEQFDQLSKADPRDPVLHAYAGAASALRARAAWLPWHKMSYAEDGLALIDQALAQLNPSHDQPMHRGVPGSLETRFVAASTFLGLPAMFNRHARGAKLLDDVLANPLLAGAPLPFRGAVWMRAAGQAQHDGRSDTAKHWFQQVVDSGAPQAAVAQGKLGEMP